MALGIDCSGPSGTMPARVRTLILDAGVVCSQFRSRSGGWRGVVAAAACADLSKLQVMRVHFIVEMVVAVVVAVVAVVVAAVVVAVAVDL